MGLNYYKIVVSIKGRAKLLGGIRRYATTDFNKVARLVQASLLKYYFENDILRVDICELTEDSDEVQEYLKKYPNVNQ